MPIVVKKVRRSAKHGRADQAEQHDRELDQVSKIKKVAKEKTGSGPGCSVAQKEIEALSPSQRSANPTPRSKSIYDQSPNTSPMAVSPSSSIINQPRAKSAPVIMYRSKSVSNMELGGSFLILYPSAPKPKIMSPKSKHLLNKWRQKYQSGSQKTQTAQ